MQLHFLAGSAIIPSIFVSSSVIGSAIAKPWGPMGAEDAVATGTAAVSSVAPPPASTPAAAAASPPASPPPASGSGATGDALVAQLLTAGTAVERYKLLAPEDFSYDFNHPPDGAVTMGVGGHTVKADRLTFPALIGTGVSMTVGFLGPCGFNTPHTHPRSAEFNIVVEGQLNAEFIAENGATIVTHNATQFQAIVFPQGAVHTEFNPTCQKSIFVAGFGNEDPGVQQSAQTFFGLNPELIAAAIGSDGQVDGQDIDQFASLLPPNVANGVQSCLSMCNIKKRDYLPQEYFK